VHRTQTVRAAPRAAEEAPRAMILETAGEHVLAGRVQGARDGLPRNRPNRLSVEFELASCVRISHPQPPAARSAGFRAPDSSGCRAARETTSCRPTCDTTIRSLHRTYSDDCRDTRPTSARRPDLQGACGPARRSEIPRPAWCRTPGNR